MLGLELKHVSKRGYRYHYSKSYDPLYTGLQHLCLACVIMKLATSSFDSQMSQMVALFIHKWYIFIDARPSPHPGELLNILKRVTQTGTAWGSWLLWVYSNKADGKLMFSCGCGMDAQQSANGHHIINSFCSKRDSTFWMVLLPALCLSHASFGWPTACTEQYYDESKWGDPFQWACQHLR